MSRDEYIDKLGMGAMIHLLGGGTQYEGAHFYGRVVSDATVTDEAVTLMFTDGTAMILTDQGQSCCEHRYITCDDDPKGMIGGTLTKVEVKTHECTTGEYGDDHEMCFVDIETSKGWITICTHNEHNGYYGGFGLNLEELKNG